MKFCFRLVALALLVTQRRYLASAFRSTRGLITTNRADGQHDCPKTDQEKQVAEYVSKRRGRIADGSIARQIASGAYTIDSLTIDMYQWWVNLGLANHGIAIQNFVDMIRDAGLPQQNSPSKDWTPIVMSWSIVIAKVAMAVAPPPVQLAAAGLYLGFLTYKTTALAMANPEQGGSTDFLKAAQMWRSKLPTKTTRRLLIIDDFIHDLKSNNTQERLLAAYEFVTELISATPSYRHVFNEYYAAYLGSTVPRREFFFTAMVDFKRIQIWKEDDIHYTMLWPAAPAGLDACLIKQRVMETNDQCIDSSTPVLGDINDVAAGRGLDDETYKACDDAVAAVSQAIMYEGLDSGWVSTLAGKLQEPSKSKLVSRILRKHGWTGMQFSRPPRREALVEDLLNSMQAPTQTFKFSTLLVLPAFPTWGAYEMPCGIFGVTWGCIDRKGRRFESDEAYSGQQVCTKLVSEDDKPRLGPVLQEMQRSCNFRIGSETKVAAYSYIETDDPNSTYAGLTQFRSLSDFEKRSC